MSVSARVLTKRIIVGLRFIERDPETDKTVTVAQYPFPDLDWRPEIVDKQTMYAAIEKLDERPHVKLANTNRMEFALDVWHSKNFYVIVKMEWKDYR